LRGALTSPRDPALLVTVVVLWAARAVRRLSAADAAGTAFIEEGRHRARSNGKRPGEASTQRAFWNSCCSARWSGSSARARIPVRLHREPRESAARLGARDRRDDVLLPLISPPFTTSIAIIFSFGPRGLITYELLGMRGTNVYGLTSTLAAKCSPISRSPI
jgi:iron(III) transport system permease protein